jgi:uncharacterized membrane protein YphA (DoxX/SURF4 family)
MRPGPLQQAIEFLSKPAWTTPVYWLLLIASVAIAVTAWRRLPAQRSARHVAIWLLRLTVALMWWQGSLWKIPPNYDGLVYWMKQIVDHAVVPLHGALVRDIVLPNIALFGPAVYAVEVFVAVSLMLGFLTRLGALAGALLVLNLWFGLYSAPGEWPWTYGFLVVIQLLFLVDPPGRSLGLDALLVRSRFGSSSRASLAI